MAVGLNLDNDTGAITHNGSPKAVINSLLPSQTVANTYLKTDGSGVISWGSPSGGTGASVTMSATPPSSPSAGDLWFQTEDASLNVYFNDVNSSQWVGVSGPSGPTGTAATIAVGTVDTGSPAEPTTVVNSGTSGAAVFDFVIQKGAKGDTGDTGTAATIAVGTVQTGSPAEPTTVTNSGSSSAAVFDFVIQKGAKGDTGTAATIAVGTVNTGSPAEPTTVTNSGSSSAAVFDFVIQKGDKGDTGATGSPGADGANTPRGFTLEAPGASEKLPMFFNADTSFGLTELRSLVGGGSPSVTWSIRYGTDFSAAGTEVVTSGITTTNTTTGTSTTSFTNGTIPADNWVWLTTTATSGTVDFLHVSVI